MAAPTRNLFGTFTTDTTAASPIVIDMTTMASGAQVGDWIVVALSINNNPSATIPTGWSRDIFNARTGSECKLAVYHHEVVTANTVPAFSTTLGSANLALAHVFRIRPSSGFSIGQITPVSTNTGNGTNPDPPAITNDSGATRDLYFICGFSGDGSNVVSTAAPTNYGNHSSQGIAVANAVAIGTADRTVNGVASGGTENPGGFTRVTEQYVSFTLGYYEITSAASLTATALETGSPEIGSPALVQIHAITATEGGVGAPALGTPTLTTSGDLVATNLATGSPVLGSPALVQVHALTASATTTSSPANDAPALVQVHTLTATAVATGSPVLATPPLGSELVLTALPTETAAPVLGSPALGQLHSLYVGDVTGAEGAELFTGDLLDPANWNIPAGAVFEVVGDDIRLSAPGDEFSASIYHSFTGGLTKGRPYRLRGTITPSFEDYGAIEVYAGPGVRDYGFGDYRTYGADVDLIFIAGQDQASGFLFLENVRPEFPGTVDWFEYTEAAVVFGGLSLKEQTPGLATGSPELGTPVLTGETFNLTANATTTASPVVGSPKLNSADLVADNLTTSSPALGTPVVAQLGVLIANPTTPSAPVLGSPALGQKHGLTATAFAGGSPALDAPAFTQNHLLDPTDVATSSPVLGTPNLFENVLGNRAILTWVEMEGRALPRDVVELLTTGAVTSSPETGEPSLAQVHDLATPTIPGPELVPDPTLANVDAWSFTGDAYGDEGKIHGGFANYTQDSFDAVFGGVSGTWNLQTGDIVEALISLDQVSSGGQYFMLRDASDGFWWTSEPPLTVLAGALKQGTYRIRWRAPEPSTQWPVITSAALNPGGTTETIIDTLSLRQLTTPPQTGSPALGSPLLAQKHTLAVTGTVTASPALASPLLGQLHKLVASALVTSSPNIAAAALGQVHALTPVSFATVGPSIPSPSLQVTRNLAATSLATGGPQIGVPAVGQVHALEPVGLVTNTPGIGAPQLIQNQGLGALNTVPSPPVLGTPALAQAQNIAATSLATSSPSLGTPALVQSHALVANSTTTSSPDLGTPDASPADQLIANGVTTGSPVVGSPAIGQGHALTAVNVTAGSPQLGSPRIIPNLVATALVTGSPVIGAPALGQVHVLVATGVALAPDIGSPPLGQLHLLTATGVTSSSPQIATPPVGQAHALIANGIVAASPVIDTPSISQAHALTATALVTGSPALGSPSMDVISHFAALDLVAGSPALGSPALVQVHLLAAAEDVTGPPDLGTPVLGAVHSLIALDLVTASPEIGPVYLLTLVALDLVTGSPQIGTPALKQWPKGAGLPARTVTGSGRAERIVTSDGNVRVVHSDGKSRTV